MAKLINSRNKKTVCPDVYIAKNLSEKMTGLLNTAHAAVIIKTRFGIHTFGIKYPIDVMILSKTNHVVKKTEGLKPMRVFFWNPSYSTVVEVPVGSLSNAEIKLGDVIEIHN